MHTSIPTRKGGARRSVRRAAALVLVVAGASAACDAGDPSRATTEPQPPATTASAPARVAPGATPMPPAGGVRLRVSDAGITFQASEAPRRDLLEMLARELGFELVVDELGNAPITASAEGAELGAVVSQLLPDRAYRIDYRLDPVTGRHRVGRLEVAPAGAVVPELQLAGGPDEDLPGSDDAATTEEPEPQIRILSSQPREEAEVDWKQVLLRLDDADAEERMAALEEIDPDGEGFTLIADRLARDPDPRVRVVAAEQLEFAETLAAVDALVLALQDPDRNVVLAAIDALEFTDDATVVNDLAPLLGSDDPEIREAAFDAIEFIRDDDDDDDENE